MPKLKKNDSGTNQKQGMDTNLVFNTDSQILNHLPVITYRHSIDDQLGCTFISRNVENILGYKASEMLGKEFWLDKIHPDDKHLVLDYIEEKMKAGHGQLHYRFLNNHNEYVWVLDQFNVIEEYGVPIEVIGNWVEITQVKDNLTLFNNRTDELTGILNRIGMQQQIKLLSEMKFFGQDHVYCHIDIDKFAVINSSCGHLAGDELIRQFSKLLTSKLGQTDFIARVDGDAFGVLLQHCNLKKAKSIFKFIQDEISEFRFVWNDLSHAITVSIGAILLNEEVQDVSRIQDNAESACRLAKHQGRNTVKIYVGSENALGKHQEEMQWVEKINRALEEDRFYLYYQPIVSLNPDIKETHYELLVRMKDTEGNLIPPGFFLPAAERYDLSVKIDYWVIQTALSWLEAYSDVIEDNVSWGINLSGQSLANSGLKEFVLDQFARKRVLHNRVYFEVTETSAIANLNNALEFILALKNLGCKFALDDFGSGLSSLGYLKNLPVDYIKIDGIFVKEIINNTTDLAMVEAIKHISNSMGKYTIAEFVENNEIKERLQEIGIDFAQGYGIGKPNPLTDFIKSQDL